MSRLLCQLSYLAMKRTVYTRGRRSWSRPRRRFDLPTWGLRLLVSARLPPQLGLKDSSSSSACPSGLTLGQTFATRPSSSMRKVERVMPMKTFP